MELTLQEMNIICHIIGCEKLAGFPLFTSQSKEESEHAIQMLEEKEIFTNGSFTNHGFSVAKTIKLYSDSNDIYKLGTGNFAKIDKEHYVGINFAKDVFRIELLDNAQLFTGILLILKNVEKIGEGKYVRKRVKSEIFKDFWEASSEIPKVFIYHINFTSNEESNKALFIDENYLKVYNFESEEMDFYPQRRIQKALENIFK